MTDRKFYRTVIQIEILSEEPYDGCNIEDICYDVSEGDCSGDIRDVVRNQCVDGAEMARLLEAQCSDPGFFMLTEDGDDEGF